MKQAIIPAILESSYRAISRKVGLVRNLAPVVQVDICDGVFVPSKTYASSGRESSVRKIIDLVHKEQALVELDLMIDWDQPRVMTRWTKTLVEARPDRVIFHLGSTYRWDELFDRIRRNAGEREFACMCGLAVRVDHSRREIRKILQAHPEFDYLQVMGTTRVGYSGYPLSKDIYSYVRALRRTFPDMKIQIDGGVKVEHVRALQDSGADKVAMNSGVFKSGDIAGVFADFA